MTTLRRLSRVGSVEYASRNKIIRGDCTIVLPILTGDYRGEIRCIYVDPPYNNGEIYSHYSDRHSHKDWTDQLEKVFLQFKDLLSKDGSLWISIDDKNMHYLKVLGDSIFGFENFISTVIWQHRTTRENRNIFSNNHEYILVFARDKSAFKKSRRKIPGGAEIEKRYKNPDNDPRGPWQSVSAHVQAGHGVPSQFYEITAPNGKKHRLPNGRCWIYNQTKMNKEIENNDIWFGKDGNGVPRIKKFPRVDLNLVTPQTLWFAQEVGTTDSAKKHSLELFKESVVFDTPKPEGLVKRILEISTDPNDLVMDAFLGSGTTAAVAHKMGRRYIGIESQSLTMKYIQRRLDLVIDGEFGGVSDEVRWNGGGGYSVWTVKASKKTT